MSQTWRHQEIEVAVLVEPDLGHSRCVLQDDIRDAAGESVRTFVSENVTDVGAGRDL